MQPITDIPLSPAKKEKFPWWGWLLIAFGVSVPMCGVVSALGIYGIKKRLTLEKEAEARVMLAKFSQGLVRCALTADRNGQPRGLPATSSPVPSSLAEVRGKKYMSQSAEWQGQAFVCAGFSLDSPQYFLYRWQQSTPQHGLITATADLDGDGAVDLAFEQAVDCNAGQCVAGELRKR